MGCGVGGRWGSDLACCGCGVGWQLQHQLDPLAWEPPYAKDSALKRPKKKKEREKTKPTKGPHPSNQWFIPFSKEWVYIYVESAHQWVWAGGGGGGLSQVFSLLWALVSPSLIWGFQTYFIHSLELRPGHSQVNAESGLWHIVDFFFLVFLRPHVQHMEVPRLGVE